MLRIERYKMDGHHATEIRALNKSIKNFYVEKRRLRVRSTAKSSTGNIWKAVGLAKYLNPNAIPVSLTVGGSMLTPKGLRELLASTSSTKLSPMFQRLELT